jgi:hypothetical protein
LKRYRYGDMWRDAPESYNSVSTLSFDLAVFTSVPQPYVIVNTSRNVYISTANGSSASPVMSSMASYTLLSQTG